MMNLRARLFTGCIVLAAAAGCMSGEVVGPRADVRPHGESAAQAATDRVWMLLHDEEGTTAANTPADSGATRGIGGFGSGN